MPLTGGSVTGTAVAPQSITPLPVSLGAPDGSPVEPPPDTALAHPVSGALAQTLGEADGVGASAAARAAPPSRTLVASAAITAA
jgi:hypothetical protein